ncbi:DUF3576 domain-containing protein [Dinoroseobacter sp. S124A]|uniref:DUF3576 domain-containing protein n=1 Tax=Dinoroseobacter sp. S124A TaxID=3415128 RepID=UPI003C7E563A
MIYPGLRASALALSLTVVAACSGFDSLGPSAPREDLPTNIDDVSGSDGSIWDLFDARDDPNTTVEVNKYIWAASLDVLDFMPVEAVDPFTGVIVMGFGTAPGSSRAYRATVYVQDPALDARSLRVALATRNGPASVDTVLAVEDAILTRARQLRLQDSQL